MAMHGKTMNMPKIAEFRQEFWPAKFCPSAPADEVDFGKERVPWLLTVRVLVAGAVGAVITLLWIVATCPGFNVVPSTTKNVDEPLLVALYVCPSRVIISAVV
jgi:hypothetical protein